MAVIELDLNSAGQTQSAVVGDEVVVVLDETPTSGYRWAPEAFDDAILAALDDAFTPPEPGLLGASGRHRFRFAIVGPGQTALRLVVRRPWDAAAVAETFETTIDAALRADGDEDVATETDEGEPGP